MPITAKVFRTALIDHHQMTVLNGFYCYYPFCVTQIHLKRFTFATFVSRAHQVTHHNKILEDYLKPYDKSGFGKYYMNNLSVSEKSTIRDHSCSNQCHSGFTLYSICNRSSHVNNSRIMVLKNVK